MKNQFTSRIVKLTFAFMFILLASSCSDDNETLDAAPLAKDQINSEISARTVAVTNGTFDFPDVICVNVEFQFCLNFPQAFAGPNPKATNVQVQLLVDGDYVQIGQGNENIQYCFNHTFTAAGDYQLRFKIGADGADTWTAVTVTVPIDCDTPSTCTESEPDTAYVGDSVGSTVKGKNGNGAWWYYLDIGSGSANVTADVWKGKTTDIGNVSYNASTKTITITLDDWFLETGNSESVKWYSYANGTLPTNGRPAPGLAPNKGTSLSFDAIEGHQYYAIHLDVATCE
jgi:hypothetical protein